MIRRIVVAAGCLLAGLVPLRAQDAPDTRALPLGDGLAVALPEGWVLDEDGQGRWDSAGFRRMGIECKTADCERTQEDCTFVFQKEPVEGADDETRLASLYAKAVSRYARIRAVLKSTSPDATLRRPLARTPLGPRDWWVVETEASGRYKSGYFAETVIGGRYLGAICRTCERREDRFETVRAMLSSADGEGGS